MTSNLDQPQLVLNPTQDSLVSDPRSTADFSAETALAIANAETLVKSGRLDDAFDSLLALEKKARNVNDGHSVTKICSFILTTYFVTLKNLDKTMDMFAQLCRKRSQLKRAIADMVDLCMKWLPEITDKEEKLKWIDTISAITEGKLFVEVQRARLIKTLADIKEADGDILCAANLVQEVHVEVIGAMDKLERANYILEQMRLVLAKGDFVRCQIMSKKLNPKILESSEFQMIKLQYYGYLCKYYLHEEDLTGLSQCFASSLSTPLVQADNPDFDISPLRQFLPVSVTKAADLFGWYLQSFLFCTFLTPLKSLKTVLVRNLDEMEMRRLAEFKPFKQLYDDFMSTRLIVYPPPYLGDILTIHPFFQNSPFTGGDERQAAMRTAMVHHNLCVISQYYEQIKLVRIGELIKVHSDEAEKGLCKLVGDGVFRAKIDRPASTVSFRKKTVPNAILNDWASNMNQILSMMDENEKLGLQS